MRKMGNTWRGVETFKKTGEKDQGVTFIAVVFLFITYYKSFQGY
jgi:hypothetical protein